MKANSNLTGDTVGTPGQTFTINLSKWIDTALNPCTVDASELTFLQTTVFYVTTGACSVMCTLSLHDALPIYVAEVGETGWTQTFGTAGDVITPTSGTDRTGNNFANFKSFDISDRKSTRLNSSHQNSTYAVVRVKTTSQTFTINLSKWIDTALNPGTVVAS